MTPEDVLEDALFRSAVIHQPHSLKSYLAMENLTTRFKSFGAREWAQCLALNAKSEVKIHGGFLPRIEAIELSTRRINWALEHGVMPVSYLAMKQWHEREGLEAIFRHFEHLATLHNEYLSHNLSILLAMKAIVPRLSENQIPPYLERLTEYVVATFSPLRADTPAETTAPALTEDQVFLAALEQPGFFAHNLIALSWVNRAKPTVSAAFYTTALRHIHQQSHWQFEDKDDYIDSARLEAIADTDSEARFQQRIEGLIHGRTHNLHQITCADALTHFWDRYPAHRPKLSKLAEYFAAA
ncbi:hypothetical protein KUV89_01070 [Marinobacter hydrocarbonoclasticus]|nr:hypothetical protein [Marinobacter nauticus]